MTTQYSYRIRTKDGVTSDHVFATNDQEAEEKVKKTATGMRPDAVILELKKAN